LLESFPGFKIGMIFVFCQLPGRAPFENVEQEFFPLSFNIPKLIPSSPGAVLLHKLKAASNSSIVFFFVTTLIFPMIHLAFQKTFAHMEE
jgi:hypothetical protein